MTDSVEIVERLPDGKLQIAAAAQAELIRLETAAKEIEERRSEYRKALVSIMRENGFDKFESEDGSLLITFIPEGDRVGFDSGSLALEFPDLFEKYKKITPVKASVRITLRKPK